jgi:hypothetical protein
MLKLLSKLGIDNLPEPFRLVQEKNDAEIRLNFKPEVRKLYSSHN